MRLCEAYQQSNMIGGDLALVSYRGRPTAVLHHTYRYAGTELHLTNLFCSRCPSYAAEATLH
jgi:hypothetical protein